MSTFIANFIPEGISDRSPMKLSQLSMPRRERRPFKFCNVWTSHPLFLDKVQEVWEQQIYGCSMWRVIKKLKNLKRSLRSLNGQHFRNILSDVKEDKNMLSRL